MFLIYIKDTKKLTGLLQILWIKKFRIDTGKKGGRGYKWDEEFFPHLTHFCFFYFIASWNYSKLIFLFF